MNNVFRFCLSLHKEIRIFSDTLIIQTNTEFSHPPPPRVRFCHLYSSWVAFSVGNCADFSGSSCTAWHRGEHLDASEKVTNTCEYLIVVLGSSSCIGLLCKSWEILLLALVTNHHNPNLLNIQFKFWLQLRGELTSCFPWAVELSFEHFAVDRKWTKKDQNEG